MESDQNVFVNRGMAWTASGELLDLSSYREGSIFGNEPPYSITSLEKGSVENFG